MRRSWLILFLALGACSKSNFNEPPPTDCTPKCDGKSCGIDGCGGTCGDCAEGEVCAVGGTCVPACVRDCTLRNCGTDECGGSCGTCVAPNPLCDTAIGQCTDCLPNCTDRLCGDDGCGGQCGIEPCADPFTCNVAGQCECTGTCGNRVCGTVCEDFCGDCNLGERCTDEGTCVVCNADCTGRVCGDDGCGGSCGDCQAEQRCTEVGQCEDCNCNGAECSDDGCCGFCPANGTNNLECSTAGLCTCNPGCTPDCADKACGPDGCGGTCGAACAATERCTYVAPETPSIDCRAFAGVSGDMTFFVSSEGNVQAGGNFGGLVGADALCQRLAAATGAAAGARTWVAYLSTTATAARDRIGMGPWRNAAGRPIVDEVCANTNTCVDALHAGNVGLAELLTENGAVLDLVNARAVFTGSDAMGRSTGIDCQDWTSQDENDQGSIGVVDAARIGAASRWNSGQTVGCDQTSAACADGRAHVYCFAP